ncbi:nuclear transport factor 2 family protein [Schaalia sp. Marseille-Q2122]|uniref:nuclear transport factor 2 family protein n=1 Tax=Schaalia sp. Marseille-Q2122 TaxID=2736604 RepID=UPI00158EC917|nr:nuclear transport factor 2 family protein [Schaalia sp. Marseille-Q2122]
MTALRDTLEAFFEAENQRDWERYVEFLHPEVEWTLHGNTIHGREAYMELITRAYANSSVTFRTHQVLESTSVNIVATLLIDEDGNRSLDIFEFGDGLIRREWEFLMGPGEGWR